MEENTTFAHTDPIAEPATPSKLPLIILGAVALLSLIMMFVFYTNWRDTEERLQAVQLDNSQYEKDSFRVSNLIQKNASDRQVIADPAYKAIVMRGTGKSPGALALLFYNPTTREVFLDIARLPEAPAGQQYQLWGMADGRTIDGGTVHHEKMKEGLLKMNPVEGARSFQLTLEKAGGASAPTGDQTYLTGGI